MAKKIDYTDPSVFAQAAVEEVSKHLKSVQEGDIVVAQHSAWYAAQLLSQVSSMLESEMAVDAGCRGALRTQTRRLNAAHSMASVLFGRTKVMQCAHFLNKSAPAVEPEPAPPPAAKKAKAKVLST